MGSKAFAYVPPGGGENFNWSSDDIFVKVSSQDTLGQYTVIEDNLKAISAWVSITIGIMRRLFIFLKGRLIFLLQEIGFRRQKIVAYIFPRGWSTHVLLQKTVVRLEC